VAWFAELHKGVWNPYGGSSFKLRWFIIRFEWFIFVRFKHTDIYAVQYLYAENC